MNIKIKEITHKEVKPVIAREVLYDLPEWFGMAESTENYISESKDKVFLACYVNDDVAGFVVLNATSDDCAEIFVMGVKKQYQRMRMGTQLMDAYERLAKKQGYSYSQVKTVKMGCYPEYDRTNRFYIAIGYKELECFPTLWNEQNPCQIYVKYLGE
ncbi:GNAT family N-acetyltransferase [Tuanshanicoccus lijuaniae]|uniref:GNAT family N-acetyltransferase n=1 Tax=Aerococcaceae bacterium zg-1292 TaxID=2774330 RepID=UPI001BD8FF1F|nr:GNAT family N-acetyltransferase [Aerococcaceae bacterium zg-A91]MBS4458547.1 GNAT family N-acetyltransferase [Aerococcaceae bacterium zg-BR33]